MAGQEINKWEIYYVKGIPKKNIPAKYVRKETYNAKLLDQFNRNENPYVALIVSNNAVNHNLTTSTALVMRPDNTDPCKPMISPVEVKLPYNISNIELRNYIIMAHTIHTVKHSQLIKPVGRILNKEIKEQVRQLLRNYFEI